MRRLIIALIACVAGSSCSDAMFACTAELRSTLSIRVFNATTGERAGAGSTIIVRGLLGDRSVYDSVTVVPQFADADYRASEDKIGGGFYTVTVRKSGFVEQTVTAQVKQDRCHAGPGPQLDVMLVPTTSPAAAAVLE